MRYTHSTLGFSTWNWKQTCTTRAMLEPLVESMVERGLVRAGYTMFMADCAGPSRAANGSVALPAEQWPGGIAGWNGFLHSHGMKAGFCGLPPAPTAGPPSPPHTHTAWPQERN